MVHLKETPKAGIVEYSAQTLHIAHKVWLNVLHETVRAWMAVGDAWLHDSAEATLGVRFGGMSSTMVGEPTRYAHSPKCVATECCRRA